MLLEASSSKEAWQWRDMSYLHLNVHEANLEASQSQLRSPEIPLKTHEPHNSIREWQLTLAGLVSLHPSRIHRATTSYEVVASRRVMNKRVKFVVCISI